MAASNLNLPSPPAGILVPPLISGIILLSEFLAPMPIWPPLPEPPLGLFASPSAPLAFIFKSFISFAYKRIDPPPPPPLPEQVIVPNPS